MNNLLLGKLIKTLGQIWEVMRPYFDGLPVDIKGVFEDLPQLFAEIEFDNDIRNKKEVYLGIAKFIKEKLNESTPFCLRATHILCGENDPRFVKDATPNADRIIESVKKLIITIKVYYEPLNDRKYNRIIEIYFLKGNQPTVSKIKEELEWDRLPPDVRDSHLRKGAETMTFKLYPKEG